MVFGRMHRNGSRRTHAFSPHWKRKSRQLSVWISVAAAVLLGLALHMMSPVVSADPPAAPPGQIRRVKTTPMDEPLRLLRDAHQVYQRVHDYTCTLFKQERVKGQLQPENAIAMKFRKQPFSVCMQWLGPKQFKGQLVCYVQGKNNNMMRVRSGGLFGAIGFVNIAPNDPQVLQHSRHTITEAGIGHMIVNLYQEWSKERELNRARVAIAEYQFNKRPCTRIEITNTQCRKEDYCYRTVLYLDKQTHLPVRLECYDFPRQGGSPQGDLLEVFSYVNMRFNVGLTEKDFDY